MNLRTALAAGQKATALPQASIAAATPVAATTITASSAIAAAEVDRIARSVQSGMVAAEPAGKAPAVAAITAAVRSGAVARRSTIDAAVLQSRHQQTTNQRGPADRNSEYRHSARHRFLCLEIGLCAAKIPYDSQYWSQNVAGPFIEYSSEMWNFRG
jgi:hypothetical protein